MGQILAGALGGLGFSIVFGVRKKYMALIALNAGLSWAVYLAVNALAGDFAGNMASAMFCSLMAAVLARRIKVPTVVLQMPATVPMIPGGRLLHDALCLLGRYAQCQALFSLYYPRYLRYGYRLCCGECPAQDAGRKA